MADKDGAAVKASANDALNYWISEGWAPGGHVREVDYEANSRGIDPMFEGIKIVDCDTHFTEPPDLFSANAPVGLAGKLPRVERIDGCDYWMVGDKNFGSLGGNVIAKDRNKLLGRLAYRTYDEIDPGSYEVASRLKAMDDMGVWAQIGFQNGGVTQGGSLVALGDPELSNTIIRMYNDACIDRMQESGDRINCMGTLPYWDEGEMKRELRRIIDGGIRGIVMPDRPERLSQPYLGLDGKVNPFWEDLFDICNSTGIPLVYHLNSALDANTAIWDNLGFDQKLPIHALLHHVGCAATLSNYIVSGLLDRYENLKIGLIESGMGWVPMWLEAMDHQLFEFRTRENRGLQKTSREYFAKNFWVSFWFEDFAPRHMVDAIGVDRIMFETDYPHPTSLYPGVQDKLVDVLKNHDRYTHERILEKNAVELFNLNF